MDGSTVTSRGSRMDKNPAPRQENSRPSAVTLQDSRRPGPPEEPGCSSAEQIRQRNIASMTAAVVVPRQNCVHMPASFYQAFLPSFCRNRRRAQDTFHFTALLYSSYRDQGPVGARRTSTTTRHTEKTNTRDALRNLCSSS
ncbi:hypothetical protein K0M31_019922 [Melipona bicolor]|uniref:Uncharacterized protein n=1 Tax=Melipona bicolor TaxID=60889 RepID=A0AA40KQ96_9HYME|nr:hypothetical protein K0M31_019922 [Melipona bicolor]